MSDTSQPTVSVVIPVYQGASTLPALLKEILPLTAQASGAAMRVTEVVLVHDGAIDDSARVMQELEAAYPFVRCVWLARNFGQHPATLAGMASTTGAWIATLDEDGQQNPEDIGRMLAAALKDGATLVYAKPVNKAPHGWLRNFCSACARAYFAHTVNNPGFKHYNSFRLIDGEIGRSLAAYCGNSVFLDVALAWVVSVPALCEVRLRKEMGRPSGYSYRKLLRHFFRLVLTSGTRPLRFIAILGAVSLILATGVTAYALWAKFHAQIPVQGWTSLVIVVSVFSGVILFSLGIIAEYLAVALTIAMGKPLYLTRSSPPRPKNG